jgi:hypothetical protein
VTSQAAMPVDLLELADRVGRLIALIGKAHIARGNYPRTEAEVARELLALADEHGVTFDKGVRDRLEREAEHYRD